MTPRDPSQLVDHLFRHQAGRTVARLMRLLGPAHMGLAEDAVQEALMRALQSWPYDGVPDNAAGWLFRVAHNFAIDAVRREKVFGDKTGAVVHALTQSADAAPVDLDVEAHLRDDELRMIFLCCHPSIPEDARVALSLKTIGGFSVREIARAFLIEEPAIAQRLVRAKRQMRDEHVTFDLPGPRELANRLDVVLDVLYLMFNEGYAAHEGHALTRQDLCLEALRLGRLVASASIATPRTHALVALMALLAARLPARVNDAGDLVLLEEQDRSCWDAQLIAMGFDHFERSMSGDEETAFHVQAAIAATHARATRMGDVEWPMILELYDRLIAIDPSPVVALNRAVAVAKVRGPEQALMAIDRLMDNRQLREYHLLLAARGEFLLELGRHADAAGAFRDALGCACSEPERRFLEGRLRNAEAAG